MIEDAHLILIRRVAALAVLGLAGLARPASAALPPNFVDQLVTSIGSPTALAFTPDGRLLIGTQPGALRVYQGGALVGTPALTISAICSGSERGLLGIAVHPQFATNNFIYLYYTANIPGGVGCKNRVSRFTLPPGNVISPASELVLIDRIHSTAGRKQLRGGGRRALYRPRVSTLAMESASDDRHSSALTGSSVAARKRRRASPAAARSCSCSSACFGAVPSSCGP